MLKQKPETTLRLDDQPSYIESRNGGYYVIGTPISLESVIHQFKEGFSVETIQHECFPSLTLEQVYGVALTIFAIRKTPEVRNLTRLDF